MTSRSDPHAVRQAAEDKRNSRQFSRKSKGWDIGVVVDLEGKPKAQKDAADEEEKISV